MGIKKIVIIFFSVFLISFLGNVIGLFPVIFNTSTYQSEGFNLIKGESFNPLKNIDVTQDCEFYFEQSLDDISSGEHLLNGKLYKCDDVNVLSQLKNEFNFTYKGSDMTTVNSTLYVLKNNKLVFETGIVLEKNICGLQSSSFGWVCNNKLIDLFSKFKRVFTPIVIIK
jgi:hypothetical protein